MTLSDRVAKRGPSCLFLVAKNTVNTTSSFENAGFELEQLVGDCLGAVLARTLDPLAVLGLLLCEVLYHLS